MILIFAIVAEIVVIVAITNAGITGITALLLWSVLPGYLLTHADQIWA